jgi:hypothetical protein
VSKVVRTQSLRRLVRPLLVTSLGTAFAGMAVWSVAGMVAAGSSLASGSSPFLPRPQFYAGERLQAHLSDKHGKSGRASRLVAAAAEPDVTASIAADRGVAPRHPDVLHVAHASGNAARFDEVVKQAGLTSDKLASLFTRSAKSHRATSRDLAPAPERFAATPAGSAIQPPVLLAYADPSPSASAALSALLAAPSNDDLAASQDPNLDINDDAAALPDYEETPSEGPEPELRPRDDQAQKPAVETAKPDVRQAVVPAVPKVVEPSKPIQPATPTPQNNVAYARPANPTEERSGSSLGDTLRNLFGGGTRAGNRVAVYDISAARVYMPDGSVLEAHSGIGKMADNPRYVNVKMTGPTPPHTYNLKLRETRFHGVEAIRMLPIDGKNKYGRDGFLMHSYLLRSGRAESHGCVAFKDYNRFITAFKQGKVNQLVVVPSGGRAGVRVASNGKSI